MVQQVPLVSPALAVQLVLLVQLVLRVVKVPQARLVPSVELALLVLEVCLALKDPEELKAQLVKRDLLARRAHQVLLEPKVPTDLQVQPDQLVPRVSQAPKVCLVLLALLASLVSLDLMAKKDTLDLLVQKDRRARMAIQVRMESQEPKVELVLLACADLQVKRALSANLAPRVNKEIKVSKVKSDPLVLLAHPARKPLAVVTSLDTAGSQITDMFHTAGRRRLSVARKGQTLVF